MSFIKRLLSFFGVAGAGIGIVLLYILARALFYALLIFFVLLILQFLGVDVPFLVAVLA